MAAAEYQTERLDHLGIVAGVCREIELAAYVDALDVRQHERASIGTTTMAMILHGLGFSNGRLYLVPSSSPTRRSLGAKCVVIESWISWKRGNGGVTSFQQCALKRT